MKIITSIFDLNKEIKDYKNIGFVPTMGGIHAGHKSLIKASQNKKKKTIVSIFVNPTQFNKKDDFKKYPRNLKKDIYILKKLKVEYLFTPNTKEIYKFKAKKFKLKKKDKILCAKFRSGHFEGVLNVMNRLMTIIKSKDLYMGEKDYQQLYLIKKFLSKKFKVRINACPTIRINRNIALSTRNKLLKKDSLKKASKIASYLKNINTHNAYVKFRQERGTLRMNGDSLTGLSLARFLDKYSERRLAYVADIKTIIETNNFMKFDKVEGLIN